MCRAGGKLVFRPVLIALHADGAAGHLKTKPGQDGAPRFLRFLETELLPTIESRYRIDPTRRILAGQSRSGYFVLWSAMEAPDLFWGRIASNPATTPHMYLAFMVRLLLLPIRLA